MKNTTKKVLIGCLFGMALLFWGAITSLWLIWPNLIETKQPLLHFSGNTCETNFTCPSTEVAAFELCFDDESYVPKFTGVMRLSGNGTLAQEFNITGFQIVNGFRGKKMVGKRRYRINFQSTNGVLLEDVMERNNNYDVEFSFSVPIPKVLLLYTGVDFKSNLALFKERRNTVRTKRAQR